MAKNIRCGDPDVHLTKEALNALRKIPSTLQHFSLIAQSNSAVLNILMCDFLFQITSYIGEEATGLSDVIDKNILGPRIVIICSLLAGVNCLANNQKFPKTQISLNGNPPLLYSV